MKIIILALIISISLHFIAFYNYENKEFNEKKHKEEIIEKKSEVKFVKLKKKEIIEEIKNTPIIEGGMVIELEKDMLTVKEKPQIIFPNKIKGKGTDFGVPPPERLFTLIRNKSHN